MFFQLSKDAHFISGGPLSQSCSTLRDLTELPSQGCFTLGRKKKFGAIHGLQLKLRRSSKPWCFTLGLEIMRISTSRWSPLGPTPVDRVCALTKGHNSSTALLVPCHNFNLLQGGAEPWPDWYQTHSPAECGHKFYDRAQAQGGKKIDKFCVGECRNLFSCQSVHENCCCNKVFLTILSTQHIACSAVSSI